MAELDVLDDRQVASHQVVDADLGIGGRRLVVASGIAIPGWKIDSDEVHRGEWSVRLRIPADKVEQVTTHVGLASIGNDDSAYGFAVDEAVVDIDSESNELVLKVKLAVMGEWSVLNRFSYQVVATLVRFTSEISGTITWPRALLDPAHLLPSEVAGNLLIQVNGREARAIIGGFGGEEETLTPLVAGEVTAVTKTETEVVARYRILNPPKGRELKVTVGTSGFTVPAGGSVSAGPTSLGADIFKLTGEKPSKAGVNFIVSALVVR